MSSYVLVLAVFVLSAFHRGQSFECGVRKINSSTVVISIENSDTTYHGQWPWHVAIYRATSYESMSYICGGTLVSSKFVLTVGACILDGDGNLPGIQTFFVRIGIFNLNVPNLNTGQNRWVRRIHQPYRYASSRNHFVVALLELSSKAVFNEYVQPACIFPLAGIDNRFEHGWQFGTTVRWGETRHDHEVVLKSFKLNILELLDCFKHDFVYDPTQGHSLFCTGSANGTDLCREDRGNGFYVEWRGAWHVAGVVSYTPQSNKHCRTDSYVGITNVFDYIKWISGVTKLTHLLEKIVIKDGIQYDPNKSYRSLLPRHCGSFIQNRITKGKTAPLFAYPWMAFLASRETDVDKIKFLCGGTLISRRYVLTARFCTSFRDPPEFVRLGEHTIAQDVDCNANDGSDCAPPFRDYDVQFIVHNKDDSNVCYKNNIALIRLKKDVIYEEHIQPVCLPVTPGLKRQKLDQYIITGWGSTDFMQSMLKSQSLQVATIGAENVTECDRNYVNYRNDPDPATGRFWIVPSYVTHVTTCVGDDGGPLGYPVPFRGSVRFVQFGVIAHGLPGCSGGPSVYINVSQHVDWIVANMEE